MQNPFFSCSRKMGETRGRERTSSFFLFALSSYPGRALNAQHRKWGLCLKGPLLFYFLQCCCHFNNTNPFFPSMVKSETPPSPFLPIHVRVNPIRTFRIEIQDFGGKRRREKGGRLLPPLYRHTCEISASVLSLFQTKYSVLNREY